MEEVSFCRAPAPEFSLAATSNIALKRLDVGRNWRIYAFPPQDLVKSHLMSAVRSEVEELRDKISKLEVRAGKTREPDALSKEIQFSPERNPIISP